MNEKLEVAEQALKEVSEKKQQLLIEINSLNNEKNYLTLEKNQLNELLERKKVEITHFEEVRTIVDSNLNQINLTEIPKELELLKKNHAILENKLNEFKETNSTNKNEINNNIELAKTELDDLKEKKAQLESIQGIQLRSLNEKKRHIKEISIELEKISAQIITFEKEVEYLNAELVTLNSERERADNDLKSNEEALADFKGKTEALNEKISFINSLIIELENEKTTVKEKKMQLLENIKVNICNALR